MKRLKYFLLQMNASTDAYKEMYEGTLVFPVPPGKLTPEILRDPTYWQNGIFYTITPTNRRDRDCPTVQIGFPADWALPKRIPPPQITACGALRRISTN